MSWGQAWLLRAGLFPVLGFFAVLMLPVVGPVAMAVGGLSGLLGAVCVFGLLWCLLGRLGR